MLSNRRGWGTGRQGWRCVRPIGLAGRGLVPAGLRSHRAEYAASRNEKCAAARAAARESDMHERIARRYARVSKLGSCYGQQGLWYTGHVGAGAQGSHGSAHGLQGLLQQPTKAPRKPTSTAAMRNLRIISLSSFSIPVRLRVPSSVLAASPGSCPPDIRRAKWFADPVPLADVGPSRRRTAAPTGAARVETATPSEGDQGDHEHQADQTLHGSNSFIVDPLRLWKLGLVSPPRARHGERTVRAMVNKAPWSAVALRSVVGSFGPRAQFLRPGGGHAASLRCLHTLILCHRPVSESR